MQKKVLTQQSQHMSCLQGPTKETHGERFRLWVGNAPMRAWIMTFCQLLPVLQLCGRECSGSAECRKMLLQECMQAFSLQAKDLRNTSCCYTSYSKVSGHGSCAAGLIILRPPAGFVGESKNPHNLANLGRLYTRNSCL